MYFFSCLGGGHISLSTLFFPTTKRSEIELMNRPHGSIHRMATLRGLSLSLSDYLFAEIRRQHLRDENTAVWLLILLNKGYVEAW